MSDRFSIYDERSNRSGTYYTLTTATKGAIGTTATVTVKHTRHDTCACLTCHSISCIHSAFVERHLKEHAA